MKVLTKAEDFKLDVAKLRIRKKINQIENN